MFERLASTPGTFEYNNQKNEIIIFLRSNGVTEDIVNNDTLSRTIDFSVILAQKIKDLLGD
jgi:hypothetical protein